MIISIRANQVIKFNTYAHCSRDRRNDLSLILKLMEKMDIREYHITSETLKKDVQKHGRVTSPIRYEYTAQARARKTVYCWYKEWCAGGRWGGQ